MAAIEIRGPADVIKKAMGYGTPKRVFRDTPVRKAVNCEALIAIKDYFKPRPDNMKKPANAIHLET
jgi:hypothetical protein